MSKIFIFVSISIFGATNSQQARNIRELVERLNEARIDAVDFYHVANMRKLIYSTKLEADALNATIPFIDFNNGTEREYPSPRSAAIFHHQNLNSAPYIFEDAIYKWMLKLAISISDFDEINPKILTREWKRKAPEYFQIVWPMASEIGCAQRIRRDGHAFLACVFDSPPVLDQPIFKIGPACSKCPRGNVCRRGLCDKK